MLMEELTEEEKDAVLAECGYTRKQLDSDLEQIKEWLKQQHHLPACRLNESDSFLKNYLMGCKGSLEKVKRKLDAYYTLRSHSEIFECRDPLDPEYQNMSNMMFLAISPRLAKGTLIRSIFSGGLPNVPRDKVDFATYTRRFVSVLELWLRQSPYLSKLCSVMDAKEITSTDLLSVNPLLMKDLIHYLLTAMPLRYTRVYLINTPPYLSTLANNMILPFLPKKHKQKLCITANGMEEVIQYFDKSVVPSDYGGELPPLRQLSAFWSDKEKEHRQWYLNELSEQCEESKRIIPHDLTNPYFGVPGSLKKLIEHSFQSIREASSLGERNNFQFNPEFLMFRLSREQKDAVLVECGYTEKQLDSDLEQIKEWLKLQHHLPACRLKENDNFLTLYLIGCKGSLEKAKRKLDAYYTYRSHSELFDNRDPLDPGCVKMRELLIFALSPAIPVGKRWVLVFGGVTEASQEEFNFLYFLRTLSNAIELWLREGGLGAQVYLLVDYEKVTAQLLKVNPLLLKDFMKYMMEALPMRFTKSSMINTPPFIAMLLNNVVLPFFPKKLRSRIHITANGIEDVIHDLDKATVPDIYGGDFAVREINEQWREEEVKRRQWYLNELSERCDESKRIVQQDPTNPYFGVPGSLKKLVVD
ncbi:uncharacterized protein [Rhodnius prolixus]|uniref:uncharacterized protein n=1 Tax=Rhodnius prolixus TaxID=13249 RepID=UPI003D188E5D